MFCFLYFNVVDSMCPHLPSMYGSCFVWGLLCRDCVVRSANVEGADKKKTNNNALIKHEWTNLGPKAEVWSHFSVIGLGLSFIKVEGAAWLMQSNKKNKKTSAAQGEVLYVNTDMCMAYGDKQ